MLTEAVLAPGSMSFAPNATQAIPNASNAIPIPYLKFTEGLYLLSHHFENKGASEMINKEFKVENQVAATSVNGSVTLSIFKNANVSSDKDK